MAKIAVLTTGHIHMPGFVNRLKARTDVQIAGVWDENNKLAEKYAGELKCEKMPDVRRALDDASIEAVVIAGATSQHDGLVVTAARAGKHVFVEKPLATTGREATRIFNAVKESGVIFQTGHFMRSDPINRFIKQEIAAGNFGEITRARHSNCHAGALRGWFDTDYRWFFLKDQSGGGGFYDMGCHSLDILVHFFGPIERVTACLAPKSLKYAIDEYGEGLLRFKNGVIGTLTGSWVDMANPVTCEIRGTAGHLAVVSGQVLYQSEKTKIAGADGKTPIDPKHFPEPLPHAFDLFFDVLSGKRNKEVLVPIEDALTVAIAMEAMYESDRLGQWVKV